MKTAATIAIAVLVAGASHQLAGADAEDCVALEGGNDGVSWDVDVDGAKTTVTINKEGETPVVVERDSSSATAVEGHGYRITPCVTAETWGDVINCQGTCYVIL